MSDAALVPSPTPTPTPPAPTGEHYGRYHLLEKIGKGGMAEIFRAVSVGAEGFRRVFVIKRIRPEKSDSAEFIKMFCEEARLCALLSHPNIVQVYDFGQIDGTYFLAMEYLRGKDLSTTMRALRLARQGMPPAIAIAITQQVAAGLHYAHTLNDAAGHEIQIIHRDVTPSNIMLLRTGGVKILDFGIAKAASPGELTDSTSGRVKGKLAYLSPEQVRCAPLDPRADVFALGVVLWEMLAGQRLFSADNEFHTMRNVLNLPVPPPSSKRPGIPASLDAVVSRALERDKEKRYPTAQAMADDLEQITDVERHSSHAIPRLLKELFGDETSMSDISRELSDAVLNAHGLPAPNPRRVSRTPPPPPLALAAIADAPPDVVLEIEPDPVSQPATAVELPTMLRHRRHVVAALAGMTLVLCLGWAGWVRLSRGGDRELSQAPNPPTAPPVVVVRPPTVVELAPAPPPPPPPTPPPAAAAPAVEQKFTASAREPVRPRATKKREAKSLSIDVTIDPFR